MDPAERITASDIILINQLKRVEESIRSFIDDAISQYGDFNIDSQSIEDFKDGAVRMVFWQTLTQYRAYAGLTLP